MTHPLCASVQMETDASQCAWTQCPRQSNKKSLCLNETWDIKPYFLSYLHFISVFTNFLLLSARGSMSGFHSPWLLHCPPDSLKLCFLEKFNSCIGLLKYALSKNPPFSHKLFCFVFRFSPLFRDWQSLIWKKSKQKHPSLKIKKIANTNSFLLSGH